MAEKNLEIYSLDEKLKKRSCAKAQNTSKDHILTGDLSLPLTMWRFSKWSPLVLAAFAQPCFFIFWPKPNICRFCLAIYFLARLPHEHTGSVSPGHTPLEFLGAQSSHKQTPPHSIPSSDLENTLLAKPLAPPTHHYRIQSARYICH